jgi:hypothetical protein
MLQDSPEDFSINLFLVNWALSQEVPQETTLLCVRPVLALSVPYLALKLAAAFRPSLQVI